MFGWAPGRHHLRGEDAGGAVEGRERLVELGHVPADRRLALDEVDREAGVGDLERRRDPGDPAADDERRRVDRDAERLERDLLADPQDAAGDDRLGLGRGGDLVGVDPRDLLADRHELAQVGVEAGALAGAAERLLVHVRRAGRDDDAVEPQLLDVLLDQLLAEARAHERVVAGHDDPVRPEPLGRPVADGRDVDGPGDVRAAVADVDADPRHRSRRAAHRSASSSSGGASAAPVASSLDGRARSRPEPPRPRRQRTPRPAAGPRSRCGRAPGGPRRARRRSRPRRVARRRPAR